MKLKKKKMLAKAGATLPKYTVQRKKAKKKHNEGGKLYRGKKPKLRGKERTGGLEGEPLEKIGATPRGDRWGGTVQKKGDLHKEDVRGKCWPNPRVQGQHGEDCPRYNPPTKDKGMNEGMGCIMTGM